MMTGRRIQVLQFLTVDSFAGTELATYHPVQAMDKNRFDVHVAFFDVPTAQLTSSIARYALRHYRGSHCQLLT